MVVHEDRGRAASARQSKRPFGTEKQAQAALTDVPADHRAGTFVAPSRMPLRELVEPWLAGLRNRRRTPTELRGYRVALDAYVLPRLGGLDVQELLASDLDAMFAGLSAQAAEAAEAVGRRR